MRQIDASTHDTTALAVLLDPLAGSAAAGSPHALDIVVTVVDRHRLAEPAIRRIVLKAHDVEDVLQDVLIRLVRSISGFRGEARFTTWLHRLARNTAIDALRRRKESDPMETDAALLDATRLSSMIATRTSLQELINRLPDAYREPIVLRDVQQLPYEDIAALLDLNLNTTKSRIARGRALLAGMIGGAGFDGGADR